MDEDEVADRPANRFDGSLAKLRDLHPVAQQGNVGFEGIRHEGLQRAIGERSAEAAPKGLQGWIAAATAQHQCAT
ncbi:hypothetical protein, partial [Mesorhizobium sp. M7A.F.Ca.US.008.03.1.1]|uniref:hypothetical protein n=1 Tax=Mesorhizobium sp. M7A.F.Ca.US.008.03.1.1 TaxID=2496742 RepID=UPI0019D1A019